MTHAATLVRLHAHHTLRAAEKWHAAERAIEPERAEMLRDEVAMHRTYAEALREALSRFDDVYIPDRRQLALLSDGEVTR